MFTYNEKEKPSSFVQRKNTSDRNDDQNLKWNAQKFSEPTQQLRASSYNFDKDVVQLHRVGDDVQIVSGRCGTDPVGIGLTCHHIIPSSKLLSFYNMCQEYIDKDPKIKYFFENWQRSAESSAEATASIRQTKIEPDGDNYQQELASACAWMSRNIFIGPESSKRIDDHGDKAIDYGGYRDMEQHKKDRDSDKSAIIQGNATMAALGSIYDNINNLIGKHVAKNITAADYPLICDTLKSLAAIARDKATLHNRRNDPRSPAYNVADWVSVGLVPIGGMLDVAIEFNRIYERYKLITPPHCSEAQKDFHDLFEKYINIKAYVNKLDMSVDGKDIRCTMARNTYNILKQACYKAFGKI